MAFRRRRFSRLRRRVLRGRRGIRRHSSRFMRRFKRRYIGRRF